MVTGRGRTVIVIWQRPLSYKNPLINQLIIIICHNSCFWTFYECYFVNWFRNLNKAEPHSRCIKSRQLQSKDKSRSLNPGSHFNKGLPLSPLITLVGSSRRGLPFKTYRSQNTFSLYANCRFYCEYNNTSTLLTGDMVTETLSIFFKNYKRELIVFCLMVICHCQN